MIELANAANVQTPQPINSMLSGFLPIILIVIFFWFIIIRPQQKKIKLHKQMLNQLKKGDKVITTSGIIGKITKVHDEYFNIEISTGIDVQFEKNSILSLYTNNNTTKNISNINKQNTDTKINDNKAKIN